MAVADQEVAALTEDRTPAVQAAGRAVGVLVVEAVSAASVGVASAAEDLAAAEEIGQEAGPA